MTAATSPSTPPAVDAAAADGRGVAGAAGRAWSRVTDMTPGQRWTSALALLLTTAVLAYGAPVARVPSPSQASTPTGAAEPSSRATFPTAAAPPASEPAAVQAGPLFVAASPPAPPTARSAEPAPTAGGEPTPPATFRPPRVVAAVRPAAVPGDDGEASVAEAHLADATFEATTMVVGEGGAGCDEISATGDVVIAGHGLDDDLTACLVGRGVLVVAHDARGERRDEAGRGQVVSTRRSVRDSLVDLAVTLGPQAVPGRVGVVAGAAHAEQVDAAVPAMRAAGVDVVTTAVVAGSEDVPAAVVGFVGEDVSTVVFAVAVDQQSAWAGVHSLLDDVRYVVADADDAIVEEGYPVSFSGALAHTRTRVPWFARTHGVTPAQEVCDHRRESGALDGSAELVRSYLWCQHVELLDAALAVARAEDVPLGDAIRRVRLMSPLTSDLAALPDGSFGPTEHAVLEWVAGCRCWTEKRPFGPGR